jgi:3-hydroxyacyl-[acyl-carrier-protein] dehydratase
MDIREIQAVLPHRYPFLLVDRVTEITDTTAAGYKLVSANEPFFQGHFPDMPVMPGVLILEALAQLGGLLAHRIEPFDREKQVLLFLGADGVRWRRPVVPGDRLDLEVELKGKRRGIVRLAGRASVDGERAAEAEMLATVRDR